jgi:type IV secretory pathway TrbD component
VSLYERTDEERVRLQARVREWAEANLLTAAQSAQLCAGLATDLRRTNCLLRAALMFFTAVVVAATFGLIVVAFDVEARSALAVLSGIGAVASFAAAWRLVRVLRLYRHGVEEGLAICGVCLCAFFAYETAATVVGRGSGGADLAVFPAIAVASALVYASFGLIYAGIAALAAAAMMPFPFDIGPVSQRLCAAALMLAAFVAARARHRAHGDDYPGDDAAVFAAAAWIGVYLTLNLRVWDFWYRWTAPPSGMPGWFLWGTYAATWILPAVGLTLGLREKDRPMIDANLTLAIVTLATNKSYLGWPRQTWDPALLGLLLMGIAIAVRRWLAASPDGERHGFTSVRLGGDQDALRALTAVSATVRAPAAPAASTQPPSTLFDGGRSGGGGATSGF